MKTNVSYNSINHTSREKSSKLRRIIGTWNLRGTYGERALRNVIRKIKKLKYNVVVKNFVEREHIFVNSGRENKRLGTEFIITKEIKGTLIGIEPIAERIYRIGIRVKYQKISIINIYAPTKEASVDIRGKFYDRPDEWMIPKCRDTNAEIEKEYMSLTKTVIFVFAKEKQMIIKLLLFWD